MPHSPAEPPRETKKPERDRWLEENREAIASIDAFIERYGLAASKLRYRPDSSRT